MLAVTTVWASLSQPMMGISIHIYLLTSLQIWPTAIYIRNACQCCSETLLQDLELARQISRKKRSFIPRFGECTRLRNREDVLVHTVTACDEWGKHHLRNVQYQLTLARLTVREDFITALCRVPELSLRPGLQRGGTTRHKHQMWLLSCRCSTGRSRKAASRPQLAALQGVLHCVTVRHIIFGCTLPPKRN